MNPYGPEPDGGWPTPVEPGWYWASHKNWLGGDMEPTALVYPRGDGELMVEYAGENNIPLSEFSWGPRIPEPWGGK